MDRSPCPLCSGPVDGGLAVNFEPPAEDAAEESRFPIDVPQLEIDRIAVSQLDGQDAGTDRDRHRPRGLMMAAVERGRYAKTRGKFADEHRLPRGEAVHAGVSGIRVAAPVVPRDPRADVALAGGKDGKIRVLDQIAGVLVVRLRADRAPDVVEQG